MQNVLNAVGWCIYAPWCILLFFSGTHSGNSNPHWGTSSSCSTYSVLNFPGILSTGACLTREFFYSTEYPFLPVKIFRFGIGLMFHTSSWRGTGCWSYTMLLPLLQVTWIIFPVWEILFQIAVHSLSSKARHGSNKFLIHNVFHGKKIIR